MIAYAKKSGIVGKDFIMCHFRLSHQQVSTVARQVRLESEPNKFLVGMLGEKLIATVDWKSVEENVEFKLFQLDRKIRQNAPFILTIEYYTLSNVRDFSSWKSPNRYRDSKYGMPRRERQTARITVTSTDTIQDVMNHPDIKSRSWSVELAFDSNGRELIKNQTLADNGIKEGSKLVLPDPNNRRLS